MKTKILTLTSAMVLVFALAGCAAQQQASEENQNHEAAISITADGWNAETDTPAVLKITSEVTEEGAEPATTEYVVVEPNANPETVALNEGNYDVAIVYPVSSDGQAFTRPLDAQALTLTVEGDNPSLNITLDQKRALTAEEIQTSIDTINTSTIDQDTKDKILAAYNSAQAGAGAATAEDAAAAPADNGGAAIAAQSSNSGSGSASAPTASAPAAPAKPAHQHSWEPVYKTTTVTVCTCCDGASFTNYSTGIARSQAASHEAALGNADPDNCHGNAHVREHYDTQQTLTGYRCACGATK